MNTTAVDMHIIAALGSAIYGTWWRRHVARDLGVHFCTVGRWMRGVGAPEMRDLYRLLNVARRRYVALLTAHEAGRQALRLPAPRPELSPPRPASTWPSNSKKYSAKLFDHEKVV
jgi:transcriptional regulator with XRE-family HTH domain